MALYDTIGRGYAAFRRPDPRIASAIETALGDAADVVNIGAGTGSYEPRDRTVLAVEPSEVMIRQRPAPPAAAPCVQGSAESIPLGTASVEAAMAILSAHHWTDLERGIREMVRVARRRIVLLTWVPDAPGAASFWLTDEYFPEILAHDRTIFPGEPALVAMLERVAGESRRTGAIAENADNGRTSAPECGSEWSGRVRVTPVPIPHDCIDGMLCAYWRRPDCYLDPERRSAISSFGRIDARAGLGKLRDDLASGRWAERNRSLLTLDVLDLGYRIISCEMGSTNN